MTTFWPQPNPGVKYVRCELPARALGGTVVDLDHQIRSYDDHLEGVEAGASVWSLPSNRVRGEAVASAQQHLGPVFVEVDDNYTNWDRVHAAEGWVEGMPDPDDPFTSSPRLHREIVTRADGVIASTPQLAQVYGSLNQNVHVCRNGVDPGDWPEPSPERESFRIVFAGAAKNQDLMLIRRAMEWAAKQDGVEAFVFGFDPKWRGVKVLPWLNDVSLYRATLVGIKPDVGLRPLETTAFSKGKSDLKILEYSMAGAMSIVQPWDPYLGWRESDLVKFAYDAKDWEQQVKWAVKHQDEVRDIAARVRAQVIETRGLDTIKAEWEAALAV